MTAYGRASREFSQGRFEVEIQGINRRHLEIHLNLPKELLRFEQDVRKWIGAKVTRGQISLYLNWRGAEGKVLAITPNIPLAKALKQAWMTIAKELHIAQELTLEMLKDEKGILLHEEAVGDENEIKNALKEVVEEALDAFEGMRKKEGSLLSTDFASRLALLKQYIEKIQELSKDATSGYREKLLERLKELFAGAENEERVLKEVALFAERIDITEEIVRFRSHLEQLETALSQEKEAKGKRCEFLLQELGRETNTIGSKTNLAPLSSLVVECKCELERLREQVQNIE